MNPLRDSVVTFPTRLCAATLVLTFATSCWLVWNDYSSYRDGDLFRGHDARLQDLRGVIIHLDEVLTMSARMAAATSDSGWERRYRQFEPELDRAINELMSLAPGEPAITASTQTAEANGRLVAMERRAFALVKEGRGQDARDVLFSETYESQKALYANGMNAFLGEIQTRFDQRLTRARQLARLSMIGSLLLLGLSISAWMAVLRTFKRTQSELKHRVEERTSELTQANQSLLLEVSERRAIQSELVDARNAALEASRLKAGFLANMSHEIRTPMNGIIGMTELALDTDLGPDQREYLETVKSCAESLMFIINDILDFSKIEAGKLTLETVDFGLRRLMADAVKPLALRADQKGVELMLHVRPDVPDQLIGDPVRLRQVLINLVGNAVKFTEQGEVVVTISHPADSADPYHLHFEVADTGIGIPQDKQSLIFESFAQADGSTTRKFGGTGLGLAIATQLVKMMDGRIWVDGEPNGGSRFHFTARFGEGGEEIEAEAPALSLAGLRVLVVDDNATNRRILEEVLTHWKAVPTLASGGVEALARMKRAEDAGEPFQVALLDVNMPEMDGFTLAERMRDLPALTGPSILMLSSADHSDALQRCRELSLSAYIVKPVTQAELYTALLRALGAAPRIEAARPTRVALQDEATRTLRVLLAEDNPVNQKLAIHLLERMGHEVRLAPNGVRAMELYRSESFDLICMDLQMPEMGGIEATAEIRRIEQKRGTRTPIIALTAHAMRGDRERCLEAGMDGYVSKPVGRDEFHAEITRVIGMLPFVAEKPEAPMVTADDRIQRRFQDDEELLRQLAIIFLEDLPVRLAAIADAFAHEDADALLRAAHTLKGGVSVLCDNGPTLVVRELEVAAKQRDLTLARAIHVRLQAQIEALRQNLLPLVTPSLLEAM